MGCDIHLMVERKSGSRWVVGEHCLEEGVFIWRDYFVFSTLVGTVRNDMGRPSITPEPRGLPEDASVPVRRFLDDADYHSHSWISDVEFKLWFPWNPHPEKMSHFALVGWSFISPSAGYYNESNTRFVFAFDN